MLAKRSWDFEYVNTAARASSDPYFDFVSFTEIKRWQKKNQQKTKQHEKQLRAAVRMLRYSSAGKKVKDMP